MGLLQEVNNTTDQIDILGLTADANYGDVRSAFCSVNNAIYTDIFIHIAADTAFQKLGAACKNWRASRSPSQVSPAPVHTSTNGTVKAPTAESL